MSKKQKYSIFFQKILLKIVLDYLKFGSIHACSAITVSSFIYYLIEYNFFTINNKFANFVIISIVEFKESYIKSDLCFLSCSFLQFLRQIDLIFEKIFFCIFHSLNRLCVSILVVSINKIFICCIYLLFFYEREIKNMLKSSFVRVGY